jgi:hypothetical protein
MYRGETNALIGEAEFAEEETAWQVLQEKLAANQKLWMPHHRNSLVWAFYLLRDGTVQNLDTSKPQMLRCVVCNPGPTASSSSHTAPPSKNTRNRVGILKYNAEHGLSSMKKHVKRDHQQEFVRYSKYAKEIEDAACDEQQKGKKRKSLPLSSIT